jgi:opacity protein-like surface antigen
MASIYVRQIKFVSHFWKANFLKYKSIFKYIFCFCFYIDGYTKSTIIYPTSPEALEKEEKFLKKVARKAFGEDKNKDDKTEGKTGKNIKTKENIKADDIYKKSTCASSEEIQKHEKMNRVAVDENYCDTTQTLQVESDLRVSNETMPSSSKAKGLSQRKVKDAQTPDQKTKRVFVGFYCGTDGNIINVYPNAEVWSKQTRPVESDYPSTDWGKGNKYEDMRGIYYGSYAYNTNNTLLRGNLYVGYDRSISKLLRLGVEIQGGIGCCEGEVSSAGVFAERAKVAPDDTIYTGGQNAQEVDFAYIRQTIGYPYALSLLQKFGITLSQWALLYTKLGFAYENIRITDHEEEIDVGVQRFPKNKPDVIFNKNKAAFIAGIGVEATIRSQLFLRMECFFTKEGKITLESQNLNDGTLKSQDRVLDHLKMKCHSVSVGFGAGFRF